jgi:3alpha(or 20beta)-hydroxysteroid dehydrogenase
VSDWQRVLDVNLTGAYLGMRAAIEPMIAGGGGSIVNISSVEGLAGSAHLHSYVAAKFGLRGITKSAAVELAEHNIRVNSIHPGLVHPDEQGRHRGIHDSHSDAPGSLTRRGLDIRRVPGQ